MYQGNQYNDFIINILKETGYETGKELNHKLQNKFSISSDNARKTISRAVSSNIIHSSAPVTFGNRQLLYFSKGKSLTKEIIMKICEENRPPLFRIIKLMDLNNGIISYYEALKISGAPLEGEKVKTDSLVKLINDLKQLKLIEIVSDDRGLLYLIDPILKEDTTKYVDLNYNRMQLDASFIPDILRTLGNINIIESALALYRNKSTPLKGVSHNNFIWDAIAYTKTTGINFVNANEAKSIEKQTLVAIDILIHRPYEDIDLQAFYSRVQSVLNSVKSAKRRILPIIVFSEIASIEVKNKIKKLGFLLFDLESIFGSNILKVINNIQILKFENQIIGKDANYETVEEALNIIKAAGQDNNLRGIKGDLFEFLIYPLLIDIYSNSSIEHGKVLTINKDKRESYEYDYIVTSPNHNEITIFELKGYPSNSRINLGEADKKNTVSWFFSKTFPLARKIYNSQLNNPRTTACYITSGGFTMDAINFMENLNNGKIKPSNLDTWYDRKKLFLILDSKGLNKVKNTIEKYYTKDDEMLDELWA